RAGHQIDLSPRLVEILAYLADRPGEIVSKDELLDRFWGDVHVTENTLTRAVADIRKALGDHPDPPQFIQTVSRRGYRFIAPVEPMSDPARLATKSSGGSDSGERRREPVRSTDLYLDWARGRAVLESLDASGLTDALRSFERVVEGTPGSAAAHVGLANACFLQFERSRVGNVLAHPFLERAIEHARRAVQLDAAMAEAWATLGFVLTASGQVDESRAAAAHAVAIEPANWRHHYRLAVATWGEERLRAVDRTLSLLPRFPAALFLSAMVHVARRALGHARDVAERGATVQAQQAGAGGLTLPAAGLHWMCGLIALAEGDAAEAAAAFGREIADARPAHVYGCEFLINAIIAQGFLHLEQRSFDRARDRFLSTLEWIPGHARARVGLVLIERLKQQKEASIEIADVHEELTRGGKHTEAALLVAAAEAWTGSTSAACAHLATLIDRAPPGPTGWNVGVDPMFRPLSGTASFEALLARIAGRAA
ncbi:MAG: winged helix-turn-helix domain-containing protein, partial [Vicinamibacterales bacterium]